MPSHRIFRWLALSRAERRLLLEALMALALARLALAILPVTTVLGRFGLRLSEGKEAEAIASDPEQAHRIGRAVRCAARHAPFRTLCLPRALASSIMLRRRGLPVALWLGVARAEGLTAHAWCVSGPAPVVGTATAAAYTVIAVYRG
ncbi:MAG: lasso peptide biosynthesis B2 protein [Alphaproteobacteria bacterium]